MESVSEFTPSLLFSGGTWKDGSLDFSDNDLIGLLKYNLSHLYKHLIDLGLDESLIKVYY